MHCSSSQRGLLWGMSTSKPELDSVGQCRKGKDLSIYLGTEEEIPAQYKGRPRGAPTGTWDPVRPGTQTGQELSLELGVHEGIMQ